MCAARRAQCLGADHAVGGIDLGGHGVVRHRIEETRPARAALELGVRTEQLGIADDAVVGAVVMTVPVLASEGALGGTALGDLELLGAEALSEDFFPGGGIGRQGVGHRRAPFAGSGRSWPLEPIGERVRGASGGAQRGKGIEGG